MNCPRLNTFYFNADFPGVVAPPSPAAVSAFLLLIQGGLSAQETGDSDPELPGIQQHVAQVKVDGKDLFNVRGISFYTAEQRAAAISERIREAAADPEIASDSLTIVVEKDYSSDYAGKRFLLKVFDADADLEQVTRETLTGIICQKIVNEIEVLLIPILVSSKSNKS